MSQNKSITRSIEEMIADSPAIDNRETFEALWGIVGEMFAKVQQRFELKRDESTADLNTYGQVDGGAGGSLSTYAGPEIDWLVHSWTGNPAITFTNMHLTINLGPQVDVPNFGFALGTIPDLFWYMDYMPRKELLMNPDYADKYYGGEANDQFIAMQRDDSFKPFVSRDLYTRVAQSPDSVCYGAPDSAANLEIISKLAHAQLDRWLAWVDAADPVPVEQRAALAERDLFVRRTISQRDPANNVAVQLYGKEMADRLVKALWGADRSLPRAIDW
jgi:hypothetical protein